MDKRVALVTGSTSGIGLGIAHALAARGCSLVITGLGNQEQIDAIKDEFKTKYDSQCDYVPAELTQVDQIEAMCKQVHDIHPQGIDILVNNAGFQHVSAVEDFPTEKWDAMLAVMLSAPFHFIKNTVSDMRTKGWGRIINIASAHAIVASPNKAGYVACKHGIVGLTKVIALETADAGITCNAICPGFVNTAILQTQVQALADKKGIAYDDAKAEFVGSFHPSKDAIGIDQIAETVVYLCSDAASQMTGSNLVMDGGWTAR